MLLERKRKRRSFDVYACSPFKWRTIPLFPYLLFSPPRFLLFKEKFRGEMFVERSRHFFIFIFVLSWAPKLDQEISQAYASHGTNFYFYVLYFIL